MCLSDCSKCKYLDRTPHHGSDIVCGLNPAYASMWKRLKSLDEYSLNCLPVDDCQEFELDPTFEDKEISLSLTFSSWQTLVRESKNPDVIKALNGTIIQLNLSLTGKQWQAIADSNSDPYIRVALEAEGIKPDRDPWIHVDSSCIDSVTYSQSTQSTLKVRASRLEYEDSHSKADALIQV